MNPIKLSEDDDEDEDMEQDTNWYKLIYSGADTLSGLKTLQAGLIVPSFAGYKTELKQDKELNIKIDENNKKNRNRSPKSPGNP